MLQQGCQTSSHGVKSSHLLIDGFQTLAADFDDRQQFAGFTAQWESLGRDHAVQIQKLLDLFQRETQFLITLDERYPFKIASFITPISRVVSGWNRQQSLPLIKPDRLNVYGGLARQFSNQHVAIVEPIPRYKARGVTPKCGRFAAFAADESRITGKPEANFPMANGQDITLPAESPGDWAANTLSPRNGVRNLDSTLLQVAHRMMVTMW
jgi:hypothetical protein